ncbi:MAG: HRDC domain-containing protein [Opitutaceae bacterium]
MPDFVFIDQQADLKVLLNDLAKVREVPIDTEADNLHHYETRVCLIQLRAGDNDYLVDPLSGIDLHPLWTALKDKVLIMHGSDFDLRLLWELDRFQPAQVFDTMLAAQLIGMKRIGLSSLLEECLGVHHPKDSQKSDWSKRPLTDKMLSYAVGDVAHLPALKKIIEDRLRQLGRLDWHRQKCDWQIEAAKSGFPKQDEFAWKVGPHHRLPPKALVALYELWHWRDGEARRLDRPPFKVMSNDYLIKLSNAVADGTIGKVYEGLPAGFKRGRAKGLKEALKRGERRDPKSLPRRPRNSSDRQPLSHEELRRQDALKACRDKEANRIGIDPTLIASRFQLAQLARDPGSTSGVLLGWQADLLKPALDALLAEVGSAELES